MSDKVKVSSGEFFSSFNEISRKITGKWRNAMVCISSGICDPEPVRRISFHENENGALLILVHNKTNAEPTEPKETP